MVKVDLSHLVDKVDFASYEAKVKTIHEGIHAKSLPGNDFLGWLNYPNEYDQNELALMMEKAKEVRSHFDTLVVCGIGGSYLGALAAINALKGLYPDDPFKIIFMGQTFSATYIAQVMDYLKNRNFAINVISKSGTTTETSISFRLLKQLLESKVGKEAAKNAIFATTDKEKGALKQEAMKEGYTTFTLPGDIGGRYSVLSPVGLFPIACAGIDIKAMLEGAKEAMNNYNNAELMNNPCYQYAVIRDYMYRHDKQCEMFVTYEPHLKEIAEWFKQLFGESEGKEHKGLLPTSATFSTDLHSLGQFIQDGSPVLFETLLFIKKPMKDIVVPHDHEDLDGLNYIENKALSFVNEKAYLGTLAAHEHDGKVNNVILEVEELNAKSLGYLFYFFMKACAMSAYLLDVNPFNQPGVEIYKKNMFHLLGKKGY
ncbi:MAG: glucose-6-phosphate isomerase [Bacilli bacterium]|nr:glucose-6-phosphate isomerase [Bacilli bacterium]